MLSKTLFASLFLTEYLDFVYRGPDRGVNLGRRVLLHPLQNVAVKIKGDLDARTPDTLLRHLGGNAAGEKVSRVRVPQVVEPDVRRAARLG